MIRDLQARNARFKALAFLGVPVNGLWARVTSGLSARVKWPAAPEGEPKELPTFEVVLVLGCTDCGRRRDEYFRVVGEGPHDYAPCEHGVVRAILAAGCTHLSALLDPDPDNLADLIMLSRLEKPGRF